MKDFLGKNRKFSSDPDTDTRSMLDIRGPEAFAQVCRALGGSEIKPPMASVLTEEHFLVRYLDWGLATRICENFAGEGLYIPKRDPGFHGRDAYITEAVMAGVPRNEIAMNLGLSASYLRRLVKKLRLSGYVADGQSRAAPPCLAHSVSTGRPLPLSSSFTRPAA